MLFCGEAESFGVDAWCCNQHPRVSQVQKNSPQ